MASSAVILWLIAIVLGVLVARRSTGELRDAVRGAVLQLAAVMPRVCLALLLAGFIGKLMPGEMIGHTIGYESGWRGVLIASMFGGMMPAGPMIAFPLVIVVRHGGGGFPQVVAFLTAWSVFAWHRVLTYEVALLGWRFAAIRMASSLLLPLISAGLAMLVCTWTGFR